MVDLPAPFWPISACTSAGSTSSEAPVSAGMPANFLSIAAHGQKRALLAGHRHESEADGRREEDDPHGARAAQ